MSIRRVLAASVLGLITAAIAVPPAAVADTSVLNYSIRDARAFLWQIHYPQSTFISEKYGPCDPEADHYGCDRNRYAPSDPKSCGDSVLGRTEEAPETPTPEEAAEGITPGQGGDSGTAAAWPRGNPVEVIHGLAFGRIGSSPEAGGMGSMFYVDQSGRRETEAHAESDAYTPNRNDYEERCAKVDSALESTYENAPIAAHVLSRADETPSVYSMTAFTTSEASAYPPGQPKEDVSIVKLWQAGGKVHGLLASTVRAIHIADQITADLIRSVISFESDGTEKGLVAHAKTEALGLTIMGKKIPALAMNDVVKIDDNGLLGDSYLGVTSPVIQVADHGAQLSIRAPGVFLAARTPLDRLPIPEDPFNMDPFPQQFRGQLTLGGHLFSEQVVYLAGASVDAGLGRIPSIPLLPFPPIPKIPGLPPITIPFITPPGPTTTGTLVPPPPQPVGLLSFVTKSLAGSPWTLATILSFTALGFIGVMGRWSQRWPWARSVARVPPFPAVGWLYRAFLKG